MIEISNIDDQIRKTTNILDNFPLNNVRMTGQKKSYTT